jgi:hypothetical protein
MPIATWYRYKAAQCGRLADDACDLEQRTKFEEEGKQWRMLAREIAEKDRAEVRPP